MKMLKEPEIKLFGRKISFPETAAGGERSGDSSNESTGDCDRCLEQSTARDGEDVGRKEKEESQRDEEVAEGEMCETSEENEESQSQSPQESESEAKSENEEKGRSSEQKGLKKPDKIIPCPRCNSMDTKFCYYNNYNVNQPRHFCKSCQRYWTAGGTMRNVPVGAGRRKNKNCSRHITISDAEAFHNLKFKTNGTVLSFGQDHPQRPPNGYYSKADECTLTRPSIETQNPGMDGFQHPAAAAAAMQGMNGFPWPFPWNAAVFPPMPYYLWNSGGWNVGPAMESLLGKHPRSGNGDAETQGEKEKRRGSIVVPKTLRMDDPEEAARSSIWTTLGIKYDAVSREGLFKALQPKGGDKKPAVGMGMAMAAASPMMQANPAALSRSLAFQERA